MSDLSTHRSSLSTRRLVLVSHFLHDVAEYAADDRAFERLAMIDQRARCRADDRTARLTVVMAVSIRDVGAVMVTIMSRCRERSLSRDEQRQAEHGCLNSLFGCHSSTSKHHE